MIERRKSVEGGARLDDALLSLHVDVAAVAVCEVGRGWRMRIDPMPTPIIHYVLAGSGILETDNGNVELTPDSFAVIPAETAHALATTGSSREEKHGLADCVAIGDGMLRLHAGDEREFVTTCGSISAIYGNSLGFFDYLSEPVEVGREYADTIRQTFDHILEELAHPVIGTRAMTSALLKQCIVMMVRSELARAQDGQSWLWTLRDERLAAVIAEILDNPAENFTIDRLAGIAAMSRSAFSKRFSEAFDMSPVDFLTLVRLNQAADLLVRTRLPIKVISGSVGYASRSHFSRTFRDHFGTDPTAFRKKYGAAGEADSWRPIRALKSLLPR